MNIENRQKNIQLEWEKGKEAFREAQVLLEQNLPTGAISRAYYAAFHAGKTILLSEGLEAKSHQGLGRLFSLHFVKSGRLDVRFSRILSKAQKYREEADYSSEYVFTLDDAKERIREIQEFIETTADFLKKAGYPVDAN